MGLGDLVGPDSSSEALVNRDLGVAARYSEK